MMNGNALQLLMEVKISMPVILSPRTPLIYVSNIAEQLIEKGLATVLRHKRDDEDRSAELDKLIIAEQA